MAERILTYPGKKPDEITCPGSDVIWDELCSQARDFAKQEPDLKDFLQKAILDHDGLGASLIAALALAISNDYLDASKIRSSFAKIITPDIEHQVACDLTAIHQRDPACTHILQAFLNFKGFKAVSAYRFAHRLWGEGQRMTALFVQGRMCDLWDIDIHPAAQIGCCVMIDHASSVVIGETAVVEDDVSLFHGVTLGGRGMEPGDRHPKVRRGAFIGAGAAILGNIEIGEGARIAAGSIVLKDIPAGATAAGMPARVITK